MGTNELDGLRPGDSVWVTGPLGNGFDMTGLLAPAALPASAVSAGPAAPRLVVVAGGVGAAPFSLMLDALVAPAAKSDPEILVLLGFRDAAHAQGAEPVDAAAARVTAAGAVCVVEVATEDGSRGPKRMVTELLAARVRPDDRVVVCGPRPMMDAVWRVCSTVGVESAWFSLETGMACGVGSCHGCAVTLADGSIARVCHDGPVFTGAAIYGREKV
jgi:dihydroorotate dehydrogenase electron transfer subunit